MRDILLLLILCAIIPAALWRPWIGVLAWVWISIMSPHRMTYGFMYDAPVAQLVAFATVLGLLATKEHRRFPPAAPVILMLVFTLWMVVTFPFSLDDGPENARQIEKILKIMLMNVVVLVPLHTRRHVDLLIAAVALSLGFFGVKGGIFAIATGGQFQVRGGGGFIEPNNELALALVMSIPLLYYLTLRVERRIARWGLYVTMFLTSVAAIASQSRGALLAMCALALAFVLRSPSRLRVLLPIVGTGLFIAVLMPDEWWSRMETIQTYEEDGSAMGRINAWIMAWRIATTHLFGGGFNLETHEIFQRYSPAPEDFHVAHSIYFQVLGQHGFVGLILYLSIWFMTFRTCSWIYRNSDSEADRQLVRLIEASLIGFAVGGAFLNLAYFDGPYYLMIALVVLRYNVLGNRQLELQKLRPIH